MLLFLIAKKIFYKLLLYPDKVQSKILPCVFAHLAVETIIKI